MIIGQRISSFMFFWNPEDATFSQEASTLKGHKWAGQLYDDAADTGFVLVSSRTGEELAFYLVDAEYHNEDVYAWHFHAATNDPKLSKLKVVIWND